MAQTILTVSTQHLGSLNATRAVEVVAELLWAEVRRLGKDQFLPHDLTLKVLTATPFFRESQSRLLEREDYDWTQVAKAFLKQYPADGLLIAHSMLSSLGEDGTITARFTSQTEEILNAVAKAFPEEVWKEVAAYLGPPIDSRAFHIREWLRKGGLTFMPPISLWQWIDAGAAIFTRTSERKCGLDLRVHIIKTRNAGSRIFKGMKPMQMFDRGSMRRSSL